MVNNPIISIIVAVDEKRGIGKDNGLLWHIPDDLRRFKKITIGHPIIMGRKTHESIGKALPGRLNIIITSNKQYQAPGCSIASSLKEAIQLAKTKDKQEIFIIGGSMVYREALPLADKLYLTLIKGVYQAKVFFPDYSNFSKIVNKVERQYGKIEYTIYELQKEN